MKQNQYNNMKIYMFGSRKVLKKKKCVKDNAFLILTCTENLLNIYVF